LPVFFPQSILMPVFIVLLDLPDIGFAEEAGVFICLPGMMHFQFNWFWVLRSEFFVFGFERY